MVWPTAVENGLPVRITFPCRILFLLSHTSSVIHSSLVVTQVQVDTNSSVILLIIQRSNVTTLFQFGRQFIPEQSSSFRVVRALQVRFTQDALECPRQQRNRKLAQDDRHDDVTTFADDAAACEMHLEKTPVELHQTRSDAYSTEKCVLGK